MYVRCPHPDCEKVIRLKGQLNVCGLAKCVCRAATLALWPSDDLLLVGEALPPDTPISKGNVVILEHRSTMLHGMTMAWLSAEKVSKGGRKPRAENGWTIPLADVVAVVKEWSSLDEGGAEWSA